MTVTWRFPFQQTTGVSSIIFGGPNTLQVNANLTAFRNSDGSFLYRYFGAGDTLYNAYLRMPDYMDTALLPFYAMQSYRFNMGEGESRSFHVKLVNTQNANLVLELEGFTDFVVARNGKLGDVLLAQPTTNGGPMPDTVGNCERQLMETAIYQGRVNYRNYIDSVRAALLGGFWAHLMNGAVTEKLFINYRNQRFNYTLYYYDRAGNLMTTVPPAVMNPL